MVYDDVVLTPFMPVIIALIVWSLIWKSIALWKCGRNNQLGWFIALVLINTAGILEIIYLLFFRKNMDERIAREAVNKKPSRRKR